LVDDALPSGVRPSRVGGEHVATDLVPSRINRAAGIAELAGIHQAGRTVLSKARQLSFQGASGHAELSGGHLVAFRYRAVIAVGGFHELAQYVEMSF
jgi:hypothetical protein